MVRAGRDRMVKLLVTEGGVDVNEDISLERETLLMVAAALGHQGIVQFLVAQGSNVNAATVRGSTPLLRAVQEGHTSVVEWLVTEGGADVNARYPRSPYGTKHEVVGFTALTMAVHEGHDDIAKWLVDQGGAD
eukprot:958599-Rhodomonas_salina.1